MCDARGVPFVRHQLRTHDVDAARIFYSELLGAEFWGPDVEVVPLPARAQAMGAPAHWLGHIGVSDVETTAEKIVGMGGQRLGPAPDACVLRDPFGAVMGLSAPIAV